MQKHWMTVMVVALPLLAACSAAEEDVAAATEGGILSEEESLGEDESDTEGAIELGTLEQAIGEAACGTNTVNRAVNFRGSTVRFAVSPPYGSATCANAFLTGLSSSPPRNGAVSIFGQLNVPQANCAQARLRSDYYVNGVTAVQQLVGSGTFRNGSCLVSTTYTFRTNRTTTTVSGTTANMAGGTPAAAANARFSAQAVNHLGAIQPFTWEINP